MDAGELRTLQAPLKQKYRDEPTRGRVMMTAVGSVLPAQLVCSVVTDAGPILAGLHPAAGGDGSQVCSGDMLLQSLIACSGVTLAAVATAMSIPLQSAELRAQAEMDFRGTLGVDRNCPVGITSINLNFLLQSQASDEQLDKLLELVERYCVVLQTLAGSAKINSSWSRTVVD